MKESGYKSYIFITISALLLILTIFITSAGVINEKPSVEKGVKLVRVDDKQKVDIFIEGTYFTSYCYPSVIEKPFLFPVVAPNGSVITRGFPIAPRKGERVDHPHHIGIWFNHGDINGLDFWNNSSAIAADKKENYGHIESQEVIRAESGKKGYLEVETEWKDNKGNILLNETAIYIFSGDGNSRTIDHISTLTAANGNVTIGDSKEGLIAIRVDRAFEMPSNESLIFTDDKGNPTKVPAVDNTGLSGMFLSSRGLKGDAVWGTRNEWVVLSGLKDNVPVSIAIFDNPKNIGFPAYAHARGYGLFSLNNLGQNSYDPKKDKVKLIIEKGKSVTFYHRIFIKSGSELTADEANSILHEFSKAY